MRDYLVFHLYSILIGFSIKYFMVLMSSSGKRGQIIKKYIDDFNAILILSDLNISKADGTLKSNRTGLWITPKQFPIIHQFAVFKNIAFLIVLGPIMVLVYIQQFYKELVKRDNLLNIKTLEIFLEYYKIRLASENNTVRENVNLIYNFYVYFFPIPFDKIEYFKFCLAHFDDIDSEYTQSENTYISNLSIFIDIAVKQLSIKYNDAGKSSILAFSKTCFEKKMDLLQAQVLFLGIFTANLQIFGENLNDALAELNRVAFDMKNK